MNFIIDNWMLISVALASGGLLLWPVVAGAGSTGLSANAAVQLINREKAVVIDVSEPDEYAAAHVSGSKNVPMAQLESRLQEVAKNKSLPVLLVCASGMRAKRAVPTVAKLGYAQVQVLAGGLGAWRAANLPLEKA